MRCESCNKFVAQDAGDIEVGDEQVLDGQFTCTVRITQCCAECGTELKEANFDVEAEVPELKDCTGDGHEVEPNTEGIDNDSSSVGSGRYRQTFYGFKGEVTFACSCGKTAKVDVQDAVAASAMDEL